MHTSSSPLPSRLDFLAGCFSSSLSCRQAVEKSVVTRLAFQPSQAELYCSTDVQLGRDIVLQFPFSECWPAPSICLLRPPGQRPSQFSPSVGHSHPSLKQSPLITRTPIYSSTPLIPLAPPSTQAAPSPHSRPRPLKQSPPITRAPVRSGIRISSKQSHSDHALPPKQKTHLLTTAWSVQL